MQQPLDLKQANRTRWIVGVSVGLLGFLHEIWLIYLFPDIGLGALALPILFGFAPCAGVLAYYVLGFPRVEKAARIVKGTLIAAILIVLVLVQLRLHPAWHGAFEMIPQYWGTFWQYPDKTDYQLIASGTHVQRVAAIAKYRSSLPDNMLVLKTGMLEGKPTYYLLEYRGSVPKYDESRLNVVDSKDTITFITEPNDPAARREWQFNASAVDSTLHSR